MRSTGLDKTSAALLDRLEEFLNVHWFRFLQDHLEGEGRLAFAVSVLGLEGIGARVGGQGHGDLQLVLAAVSRDRKAAAILQRSVIFKPGDCGQKRVANIS